MIDRRGFLAALIVAPLAPRLMPKPAPAGFINFTEIVRTPFGWTPGGRPWTDEEHARVIVDMEQEIAMFLPDPKLLHHLVPSPRA